MTDSRHDAPLGGENIFGEAEPARDLALAGLIGDVVGVLPMDDVNWTALAARIAVARAGQRTAWWSYAARWERRAIPLALAAGLAGIFALWSLGGPMPVRPTASDPVAALVEGTPSVDAARSFAQSLTGDSDPVSVELY